MTVDTATDLRPFRAGVPEVDLLDLHDRLSRIRWPDELPDAASGTPAGPGIIAGPEWNYGVPLKYVQDLTEYWRTMFDWRAVEARLNQYPQFTTTIDGQNVHFLHVRSPEPNALPLIVTHGWPMSVLEYVDLVGPLTNPRAHGGHAADAFDLVIPSLPGFGFSGPTHERGWDSRRIARAWAELMRRLGYARYGAHGNDAGSLVSPEVGRFDPQHVIGVHVTQIFSFPSGDPAELEALSERDLRRLQFLDFFNNEMSAFNKLQSTQPQTLAYALNDSPVGQLAWSAQLFGNAVDREYIVGNVCLYWLTRTAGSSARIYFEDFHAQRKATVPTTTPTGVAVFAFDFQSVRRLAERDHKNIVHWKEYDRGGHFPAQMTPDLLVDDIREFFGGLREVTA
jgi:epoxide hydrolase